MFKGFVSTQGVFPLTTTLVGFPEIRQVEKRPHTPCATSLAEAMDYTFKPSPYWANMSWSLDISGTFSDRALVHYRTMSKDDLFVCQKSSHYELHAMFTALLPPRLPNSPTPRAPVATAQGLADPDQPSDFQGEAPPGFPCEEIPLKWCFPVDMRWHQLCQPKPHLVWPLELGHHLVRITILPNLEGFPSIFASAIKLQKTFPIKVPRKNVN